MVLFASQAVDVPGVGIIATIVSGVVIGIFYALKSIKKDTSSTSSAVNHKKAGEPTIAKQVEQSASDVVELKYDMKHVKSDISEMKIAMNNLQGMIEHLLQQHVLTQAQVKDLIVAIPKRKGD